MNRYMTFALSGSQVVPWTVLAATVPPVTLSWYQRGAAKPVAFARRTVCEIQSDSAPPIFMYWACTIARIWSTSRALPASEGALGTAAFGQLVALSGVSGPVKVDVEILSQSTCSL